MTGGLAAMRPREAAHGFLAANGWGDAVIRPLAGDASNRRYFRLSLAAETRLLMDAPPPAEDVRPFVKVGDGLRKLGLSAPRVFAADEGQGFLLLEDFGDDVVGAVLRRAPERERDIYAQAIDILARLATVPPPVPLPPYDADALMQEAMLFPEWYARAAGLTADVPAFRAAWEACWQDVLRETSIMPVMALRDFHADNLMVIDRPAERGLGLLDYQDALAGHQAYDLVSFLQDARRDLSSGLEDEMIDLFIDKAGIADREAFLASYEVLGAQRNVKILGIFVRLRDRDGKAGYVERLPRVWGHVARNFAHPALRPVRDWFDRFVPPEKRSPWCVAEGAGRR